MTGLIIPRRQFLLGLTGLLAAPAIVRFDSLMPVRALILPTFTYQWLLDGVPIKGATDQNFDMWEYLPLHTKRGGMVTCRVTMT